jgi:hypothetical protein
MFKILIKGYTIGPSLFSAEIGSTNQKPERQEGHRNFTLMVRITCRKKRLSPELTKTRLETHVGFGAAFSENIIIIHRISNGEEIEEKRSNVTLSSMVRNVGVLCGMGGPRTHRAGNRQAAFLPGTSKTSSLPSDHARVRHL